MFDDEKIRIIESMPDADSLIVIWVKLLCQAGKTYAGGYICLHENIPYTEEELASVLARPVNTVRLAINTFKRLGMIEVDNNGIFITNFPKHQNIEAMERSKENARLRQAKHRQLLKEGNKDVTQGSRVSHVKITALDKDKDIRNKKKDKDKDDPPIIPLLSPSQSPSVLNNFILYSENIEPLTPLLEKEIRELEKTYPAMWLRDAIKEAIMHNQPRMSYIKGVLANWNKEGHICKA